jgi:hypothetical protein
MIASDGKAIKRIILVGSIRQYGRATPGSEEAIPHGFSQVKRIYVDLLMASRI